MLIFRIINVS